MFAQTQDEITQALEKYFEIDGNWSIDQQGKVVVDGVCTLIEPSTTGILPVRFSSVSEHFEIPNGNLNSLEGCPVSVGQDFNASHNPLRNLKYAPKKVGLRVMLNNCGLTNLNGFACDCRAFFLNDNDLTTLAGLTPAHGGGGKSTLVKVARNRLQDMHGWSIYIAGVEMPHQKVPVTSLEGLPTNIQMIMIDVNTPILELLFMPNLKIDKIMFPKEDQDANATKIAHLMDLLKKYKPLGPDGVMPMAMELRRMGYAENARL